MKKVLSLTVSILIILVSLAGCSDPNSGRPGNSSVQGVNDVLKAGMDAEDGKTAETEETGKATESVTVDVSGRYSDGVDIDLTKMSSTMVYSEVYSMLMSPDDYIGKTIKMTGSYSVYEDAQTGDKYFACVIQDATACCGQGMEFVLVDEYEYPNDYPELGEEITVTGVFDTYLEGKFRYCTVRDAVLN